jgi:superfamily II DNA/RNA helicase
MATEMMRQAVLGKRRINEALEATLEAKLDAAVEAVIESGTNCLVFTWMKEHSHRLASMLEKTGRPTLLINGDLAHKQRELVVAQATKTKCNVVATIDSCGVGVDGLQHVTSNVIYHALDYVPIKMSQSLARIDRIGQRSPVTATFIVMEDSYDQMVMETVIDKLDQWMRVMGRDDNTAIRDVMVDGKSLALMEQAALKAIYEAWSG